MKRLLYAICLLCVSCASLERDSFPWSLSERLRARKESGWSQERAKMAIDSQGRTLYYDVECLEVGMPISHVLKLYGRPCRTFTEFDSEQRYDVLWFGPMDYAYYEKHDWCNDIVTCTFMDGILANWNF